MKKRLLHSFGEELRPYDVEGDPKDLAGALELAAHDRFQFEWWALGLIDALPAHDRRRGADTGIDGYLRFPGEKKGSFDTIICQVKSGSVNVAIIRDLKGVMEREHAAIGVLVTLNRPTRPMMQEAISAGFYEHAVSGIPGRYPRIQILTIEDIFNGRSIQYPRQSHSQHRRAKRRAKGPEPSQPSLLD
jgi:site-specific DNA-methyltransferase (adenine-specific)